VFRHSRGIPRLINTVCENALITGYARQERSITPDIIKGVAADFRLGVVHAPRVETPKRDGNELLNAVQSLLDFREYLLGEQAKEKGLRIAVSSGRVGKHEPYI
jgi:general secretion pathway protein A